MSFSRTRTPQRLLIFFHFEWKRKIKIAFVVVVWLVNFIQIRYFYSSVCASVLFCLYACVVFEVKVLYKIYNNSHVNIYKNEKRMNQMNDKKMGFAVIHNEWKWRLLGRIFFLIALSLSLEHGIQKKKQFLRYEKINIHKKKTRAFIFISHSPIVSVCTIFEKE